MNETLFWPALECCMLFPIASFSLKTQEGVWRQYVKENDGNELLLANCIAASAFLTYSGPVNVDTRSVSHGAPLQPAMAALSERLAWTEHLKELLEP